MTRAHPFVMALDGKPARAHGGRGGAQPRQPQ